MSNSFSRTLAFLLIITLAFSCSTEYAPLQNENTANNQATSSKSYANVDRALWPYYEAFEEAASEYNLSFDLEKLDITGVIEEISESGVAGTCQYGQHIHHVTIDRSFWNQSSSTRKEMVVFHELGHCVLARGHREKEDANGACLSIMNSGTSGCAVLYNETNRDFYLEELFSQE